MLKVSAHAHPESPISGSTVESMIDRAIALGRSHFSYTDPAYMTSIFRGYEYAKKKGIRYIPGLEIFFKDNSCDIVKGSNAEKASYFKLTLYAKDQKSFQKLSEISSKNKKLQIKYYGENYPALDWADLEEAAEAGLLAVSSDIHDMVSKHIVTNTPQLGEKILLKLKSLFGRNYSIAIVGNEVTHSWVSLVKFKLENGVEDIIYSNSRVSTNAARFVQAREMVEKPKKHFSLKSYRKNLANISLSDKGVRILSCSSHSGFLRFPEGDVQQKANRFMYGLAKRHGIDVLYSDYAFYSEPEDKAVQDVRLFQDDIRDHTKRHMQSSEEAASYLKNKLGLPDLEIEKIFNNNSRWASEFDYLDLKYEYRLPEVEGESPALNICLDKIRQMGRLPKDQAYHDRLKYEISVLSKNGKLDLIPYFLPIKDVLDFYDRNGRLTGPARGSAGGSLLMYLMGITHVDPIKYGLSFERFLSLDRILNGDMPDVDVDLVDREPLVGPDGSSGYLYGRWGDRAAQISTRIQLRLKSAIKDVSRYLNNGKIDPEIEKLSKALPPPPQGISDKDFAFGFEDTDGNHIPGLIEVNPDLQDYAKNRPKEWELVQRCLGISRQNSKHASAFVISDTPIKSILPTFMNNITQYEAKSVEKARLIKYDFLVVNQLKDIELCIKFVNKKQGKISKTGFFQHVDGRELYVWDLPEDLAVFKSVWDGDTETIFQINTQSMVPFVKKIMPKSLIDLATILALVRPGPLDFVDPQTGLTMAAEYIERRNGQGTVKLPELMELLPETYGIQIFQEQSTKVAKDIGQMKPTDAENLRRAFSKKDKKKALLMKPLFMDGAIKTVGQEKAEMIWSQMETSSRYSFNKSHAVAYAMITYACMFLKHYYPLEWWAAVLTNADEEEITTSLFKHVRDKVSPPDINLSSDTMEIDYASGKIRAKLGVLKGMGDTVIQPIIQNRPYADIKDFVRKKVSGPSLTRKLIHVGVMDSLFPSGYTLLAKMQSYEDAIHEVAYEEKIKQGKKVKVPKKGEIDKQYLSLSPLQDFKLKKSILPTLPSNLSNLVIKYCPLMNESHNADRPRYADSKGRPKTMLTGDEFSKVESGLPTNSDFYFCVPAFVIKAEEFSFSNNTKKALKLFLDIDGRISERVLWPPWEQDAPKYPKELVKGSIVLVFMSAQSGREEIKINEIKVLA
jgi:DNA-directed DNA polymerase III PolC